MTPRVAPYLFWACALNVALPEPPAWLQHLFMRYGLAHIPGQCYRRVENACRVVFYDAVDISVATRIFLSTRNAGCYLTGRGRV